MKTQTVVIRAKDLSPAPPINTLNEKDALEHRDLCQAVLARYQRGEFDDILTTQELRDNFLANVESSLAEIGARLQALKLS